MPWVPLTSDTALIQRRFASAGTLLRCQRVAAIAAGKHRTVVANGVGVRGGHRDRVEAGIVEGLLEAHLIERADLRVAVLHLPASARRRWCGE